MPPEGLACPRKDSLHPGFRRAKHPRRRTRIRLAAPAARDSENTRNWFDSENRLLWRFPIRRLEAEQIRDSILAVTGELQLDAGGPAVDTFKPRRSIYTKVMRNNRDPLLEAFDAPQNFFSASQRDTTTTPVQSLMLINSQYMLERAQAMAARLQRSGAKTDDELTGLAYKLAFGRAPTSDELSTAAKFLREQQAWTWSAPVRRRPVLSRTRFRIAMARRL